MKTKIFVKQDIDDYLINVDAKDKSYYYRERRKKDVVKIIITEMQNAKKNNRSGAVLKAPEEIMQLVPEEWRYIPSVRGAPKKFNGSKRFNLRLSTDDYQIAQSLSKKLNDINLNEVCRLALHHAYNNFKDK
jgi:hypothetical protein